MRQAAATERFAPGTLRTRLLLSACAILTPGLAHAQATTDVPMSTTRTTVITAGGTDSITVEGSIVVTGNGTNTIRAINLNANGTGAGPTIVNSGTITSVAGLNSRGIDSTGDFANRNVTITNLAGGTISGATDAIRVLNTANAATGSIIKVINTGAITSTGGQSIEVSGMSGATLDLTNNVGGTITGIQGVFNDSAATIVNNGTITGTSGTGEAIRLTGNGTNTITLGANSITQNTTGTANANAIFLFGTGANTINIAAGAQFGRLKGSANSANDTLNLGGSGNGTLGLAVDFDALNVNSGTWSLTANNTMINGLTTIANGATLQYVDSGTFGGLILSNIVNNGQLIDARSTVAVQSSVISGSGSVRVTNAAGTLELAAANSYSGGTFIDAGRIFTDIDNALSPNSAVTVATGAVLSLNDGTTVDALGNPAPVAHSQVIANLSGAGTVRLGQLNAATLTTGGGGGNTEFSGSFTQLGNVTKVGAGTFTLSGASTATGLLRASGGAVALTGSFAGAGQVDNGARLTGTGSLAGTLTVANGGILAPGNGGIGTLTVGGLALSSGSVLNFDVGANRTSDRVTVNGDLTLDGTLNLTDVGGFGQGVYRLIDYGGALTDNGLAVGTVPAGADPAQIVVQTAVSRQVNLVYGTIAAAPVQFWDGVNQTANGVIDGGSGSWTTNLANWTNADGSENTAWGGNFAVLQGAPGTVTVDGAIGFNGAQFITDGYVVAPGTGTLSATDPQTNLRVDPGVTGTISANIGGTGGLLKNDAGTLILSGVNTYAGATTIAGGTLRTLGGAAIPVTSAVAVQSGATLDLGSDQTIGSLAGVGAVTLTSGSLTTGGLNSATTFSGMISGAGGLTKAGIGIFTLGGVNSYTGATSVAAGTLTAGAAGAIGSGRLDVASAATVNLAGFTTSVGALSGAGRILIGGNGNLTTTSATNSVFSGQINGAGATFTKAGAGTLTLSGTTGGFGSSVVVAGGRLQVTDPGALANSAMIAVSTGATFDIAVDKTIAGLTGTGTVALNANRLTVNTATTGAFDGAATGTGGLTKSGAGALTLSGTNLYSGDTLVSAGTLFVTGTLAGNASAAGGATIGGSGTIAGTLTIADATLAPGTTGAGTLTTGGLMLSANSILAYDLGAPNVSGASDRVQVNGNLTLDGTLNASNAGGFGIGVYRLIDYTGALTNNVLDVGTLPTGFVASQTQVQTSVAGQVNLVVAQAIPEIQFWDGPNTTANGLVDGGTGSWNTTTTNWTTAAGDANAAWAGRFAVFQGTAGTVTVNGPIVFTGMQFMTNGYTIAPGTGTLTISGTTANLRADPGVTAAISAAIGGAAGIQKLDAGTVILSGVNTYTGATTIAGGTLAIGQGGSIAASSGVALTGAGATFDVTGTGAQSIQTLSGVAGTTLKLGSAVLTQTNAADTNYAGVITGIGGLTKAGAGVLTLSGANAYTGATTVAAGVLRAGAARSFAPGALVVQAGATADLAGLAQTVGAISGPGAITLGAATLTVGDTTSSEFGGIVSGTGGLTKVGTGTLTLSGANSYTGATAINAGLLTVNGSLASAVTIGASGRLGGTGTVGAVTVNGTIAPGNSIGTIAVNGALTFAAGSTYLVEVNPAGASDRINATGAVRINGGAVSVLAGAGMYKLRTDYTILTSGGGVTGTFTAVTTDMAFLTPSLLYSSGAVTLRLLRNDTSFASVGTSPNQIAVGTALDRSQSGPLFEAVVDLDAASARGAFDALSGEVHADALTIANRDAQNGQRALLDRAAAVTDEDGVAIWLQGNGGRGTVDARGGFSRVGLDRYGVLGGVEYSKDTLRVGVAGGYNEANGDLGTIAGHAKLKTIQLGIYGGFAAGNFHVRAGAGYLNHEVSTRRSVTIGTLVDAPTARYLGDTLQAYGEVGYAFGDEKFSVEPFGGLSYACTRLDSFTETGGAAALTFRADTVTSTLATAGLRAGGLGWIGEGVRFDLELAARHYLGGERGLRQATFAGTSQNFTVTGADFGRTGGLGRIGISVPALDGRIGAAIDGDVSSEGSTYGGRLSASWRF